MCTLTHFGMCFFFGWVQKSKTDFVCEMRFNLNVPKQFVRFELISVEIGIFVVVFGTILIDLDRMHV